MSGGGRTAVVLFNLGGPDSPESVRPFLFNLFNDPAIIRVPKPMRWMLAQFISRSRAPTAREIYGHIGGKSPILENTTAQAQALEETIGPLEGDLKVFIAMRYWHPMTEETVEAVKGFGPQRVVLLPLYPQWSTTTSASSLRVWKAACTNAGFDVPTSMVCCYPEEPGFIAAEAALIRKARDEAAAYGTPRVLFSAHGLPKRIVDAGDPYPWQCERTVSSLVGAVGIEGLDHVLCYQSKVGPLEWIGPATDAEIERAGRDGVPVVVAPMAFVSEHSETLVELDLEYRALAERCGVPYFSRVPTVGVEPAFIAGLANLVRHAVSRGSGIGGPSGKRLCPAESCGCAMAGP